jgi:hypothetical protein
MVRRLYYALTGGKTEADVLVYHPMESFWLHYLPDQNFTHGFFQGPFLQDEKAAQIDREEQLLLNGLSSENLDFELIHRDAVGNFAVSDGKIVNRLNGQEFSVLVLPMCEVLTIEAARLCLEYVKAGGTVLALGELPRYAMPAEEDSRLRQIVEELSGYDRFILMPIEDKKVIYEKIRETIPMPVEIVEGTAKNVNNHPAYESYLIDPYMHGGEDISGVLFTRYQKDGKRHTLFMNYSDQPDTISVRVAGATLPEVWDTFTGDIYPAELLHQEADACIIRLTLPSSHGLVLVSDL